MNHCRSLTLEVRVVGDSGQVFESHAHFIVDERGRIDVCRDPSVGWILQRCFSHGTIIEHQKSTRAEKSNSTDEILCQ